MATVMRADAQDNRRRILAAAEKVYESGEDASTERVAELAHVGIATVFRHFPTKAALLEAVLVTRLARLREQAQALLDADDPGAALSGFFTHLVIDAAGKLAIAEALRASGGDGTEAQQASYALHAAVGELLSRAQEAGAVRPDLGLDEFYALLIGASKGAAAMELDEAARDRMLEVVFAGLRPMEGRSRTT
jgi:AcrR family transcriptional regulator